MGRRKAPQGSPSTGEDSADSQPEPGRKKRNRHHDSRSASSEDRRSERESREHQREYHHHHHHHHHHQETDRHSTKDRRRTAEARAQEGRHHDEGRFYDEIYLYSRPLSSCYSSGARAASRSGPGSSRSPAPDERAERGSPWQHWALRIGDRFYEAFKRGDWLEFRSYGDGEAYHRWGWRSQHVEKYLGRTGLAPWQIEQKAWYACPHKRYNASNNCQFFVYNLFEALKPDILHPRSLPTPPAHTIKTALMGATVTLASLSVYLLSWQ